MAAFFNGKYPGRIQRGHSDAASSTLFPQKILKILFLTQVLPYPLDAGPKIRAYYVAKYLASAGHDVTLLSFIRSGDRPEYIDHLREFCTRVETILLKRSRLRDAYHLIRAVARGLPFIICRDENRRMSARIRELVKSVDFDALHSDQLWMAPYALMGGRGRNSLLVLDQHNAVFQIPDRLANGEKNTLKRALLRREANRLYRCERAFCGRFDTVVWVSREDQQALDAAHSLGTFQEVIPICVDPEQQPVIERSLRARRITFLGGLHWPPNSQGVLWFAREVWPEIRRRVPDARFTVIGKDPPTELGEISSTGIDVTGYVADIEPYLKETAVFVVPLHAGGGMRVKILDAWCRGLPVVTTTIGAEGIDYREGENVLLADSPKDFASAVIRIFQEWWLAERLSRLGRRTVETEYNWKRTYRSWERVYSRRQETPQPRLMPTEFPALNDWIADAKAR